MPKYEVIKPWNGVSKGQVLELDSLASALLPNVREIGALKNGSLTLDVSFQVDEATKQALAEAQAKMLEGSQWVGMAFAEKARAMHLGDEAHAPIHGQASAEEAKALIEEGVAVAPLPLPVVPPEQRN